MTKWLALPLMSLGLAIALLATNIAPGWPAAEASANLIAVAGQQCLSAKDVRMAFTWNGYNEGSQWVDLSLTNNGFIPGTFVGIGPIGSSRGPIYQNLP